MQEKTERLLDRPTPSEEEEGVPKGYRADITCITGAIKRATIVLVNGCCGIFFQEATGCASIGKRKRNPAEEGHQA